MRRSTRKRLSTALSAALIAGLAVVARRARGQRAHRLSSMTWSMGLPGGNGWFSFTAPSAGRHQPNTRGPAPRRRRPHSPSDGLGLRWDPGFYGGFGQDPGPTTRPARDHFNLWINPDAGQEFTLEFNLQGRDADARDPMTDEFQFDCVVSAAWPVRVSGGGWQLVSIPLSDFLDDNSLLPGGDGDARSPPVGNGHGRCRGRDRDRIRRQLPYRLLGLQPWGLRPRARSSTTSSRQWLGAALPGWAAPRLLHVPGRLSAIVDQQGPHTA